MAFVYRYLIVLVLWIAPEVTVMLQSFFNPRSYIMHNKCRQRRPHLRNSPFRACYGMHARRRRQLLVKDGRVGRWWEIWTRSSRAHAIRWWERGNESDLAVSAENPSEPINRAGLQGAMGENGNCVNNEPAEYDHTCCRIILSSTDVTLRSFRSPYILSFSFFVNRGVSSVSMAVKRLWALCVWRDRLKFLSLLRGSVHSCWTLGTGSTGTEAAAHHAVNGDRDWSTTCFMIEICFIFSCQRATALTYF